ncbi:UPF0481 protein At3g47200 [Linum grandiflorum]
MKKQAGDQTLLKRTAGRASCCIFRIPQTLIDMNPKAYHPTTVSIGPYHRGELHLETIQQHKWRFLQAIVDRIGQPDCLTRLFKAVADDEEDIRDSYSESTAHLGSEEFVEMIVLDGCFVIEMFCIVGGVVGMEPDDPVFNVSWMLSFIMRDLLRLENQVPIFVLKSLYEIAILDGSVKEVPSLTELALRFFDHGFERPEEVLEKYKDVGGKHLLDLFRRTFIPKGREESQRQNNGFLHLPQSVRKLRLAGVRFRPCRPEPDTILDVKFSKRTGILEIPLLTIDDFTSYALMNLVAFEQCYAHCSNHVTIYTAFVGSLINNVEDAEYLSNRKILENFLGTDEEVTTLFNELGKDVVTDLQTAYLGEVFEEVNRYCVSSWNVGWSGFKLTYFESPWSFISAAAVGLALVLTFLQTFFAVYGYYRPR